MVRRRQASRLRAEWRVGAAHHAAVLSRRADVVVPDVVFSITAASLARASDRRAQPGKCALTGDTENQQPDPVSRRIQSVRYSIVNWDTQLGSNLVTMVGRFDQNRTESLWQGSVYEKYEIDQMRRVVSELEEGIEPRTND